MVLGENNVPSQIFIRPLIIPRQPFVDKINQGLRAVNRKIALCNVLFASKQKCHIYTNLHP